MTCDVLGQTCAMTQSERAQLVRHARESAEMLFAGRGGSVVIRIVGDAEMAAAHERYTGVAGTTDVLTFDLSEPGGPAEIDLLLCSDVAAREAASRGGPAWRELLLYAVHGMLHCAGHDDHGEADAAAMHRREDEILAELGVGPVYRSGGELP